MSSRFYRRVSLRKERTSLSIEIASSFVSCRFLYIEGRGSSQGHLNSPSPPLSPLEQFRGRRGGGLLLVSLSLSFRLARRIRVAKAKCRGRPPRVHRLRRASRSNAISRAKAANNFPSSSFSPFFQREKG